VFVLLLQKDSRSGSSLAGDCNLSQIGSDEPTSATSSTTVQCLRPKKRNSNALDPNLTTEVLLNVNNHYKRLTKSDDRFDIFGKNVAMKLRDLNREQRILVENIINKALFLAEMDTLTIGHKISGPSYNEVPPVND